MDVVVEIRKGIGNALREVTCRVIALEVSR
jgi:hypothetical protein